eukprot:TRINITY_DN45689_c0_g1_i2.p1 TRINITY_DN45689_c0_g1~~TRINITY_DN45689_c0_g1_i2.p1  ORF type:complete len:255 (-),score=43.73 TRINITY_DN45689_c0_g1_i2:27-791(-)
MNSEAELQRYLLDTSQPDLSLDDIDPFTAELFLYDALHPEASFDHPTIPALAFPGAETVNGSPLGAKLPAALRPIDGNSPLLTSPLVTHRSSNPLFNTSPTPSSPEPCRQTNRDRSLERRLNEVEQESEGLRRELAMWQSRHVQGQVTMKRQLRSSRLHGGEESTESWPNSSRVWSDGSTSDGVLAVSEQGARVQTMLRVPQERILHFSRTVRQRVSTSRLSLIHISEPTRLLSISYAVFCLKKKKTNNLRLDD